MADVLQSVQDVLKKWEARSVPRTRFNSNRQWHYSEGRRPRIVRSSSEDFHRSDRRRQQRSVTAKMPKYHDIYQFKMDPTIIPLNRQQPFVGLCCPKCLPRSRAALPHSYIQSLCVCNLFLLPFMETTPMYMVPSPLQFFHFMLTRCSNFNYPDVTDRVLHNDRIMDEVRQISETTANFGISESEVDKEVPGEECVQVLISRHQAEIQKMLSTMKTSINKFFLKLSSLFLYNTLNFIFKSIQVHKGHLEMLKSAVEEEHPIVYIPMHRSHLDYVLVSLVLYMNSFKVPLIAVGENFVFPFFSKLMKYLGAFIVKNRQSMASGKEDILYRAVLHSYMVECLKASHSVEIFVESSRSRTGRSTMPKTGLLAPIVDSVLEGEIEDAFIVPVAISYEKLLEGNFVDEQLGKSKAPTNFWSTLCSAWKMLHSNFGSIRVDFCQPFSLKEFLESNKKASSLNASSVNVETPPSSPSSSCSSSGSLVPTIITPNHLNTVVKNLANHIVFNATSSSAVMSTQLVAFLFLTKHRQGATLPQLTSSFNWLREDLIKRKCVVGFSGESSSVIKHAISLLGKEILQTEVIELEWTSSDMENNNIKVLFHQPIIKLPYVLELQYYANAVIPVFVVDSIVVNALYAVIDEEICHFQLCDSRLLVYRDDLVNKSLELCNMLSFEFILIPPCEDIVTIINEVIEELVSKNCLTVTWVGNYGSSVVQKRLASRSHYLSFHGSDDDEEEASKPNANQEPLKVHLSEDSIDYLKFLRNIISPCIESYWLSACTLLKLVQNVVEEKEFLREIQRTAEDRLHKGLLCFEESFGTATLKNSLKLFESWQVLEHYYEDGLKFLHLSENYDSEDQISAIIARIEQFRQ